MTNSNQLNIQPQASFDGNAVAIIGMAGRFPGAQNLHQFWHNLSNGVESVSFFSDEELLASGIPPELVSHPDFVKGCGSLSNIDLFDAAFFGFSPREAEVLDPQYRLFLEQAHTALEDAGYDPERYSGRIGVYGGATISNYMLNNLLMNQDVIESVGDFQVMLGNARDYLPTLVAYKLNLKGPAINVQTACSTSLVAIHLACQSLQNGDSDIVLAGGSSVTIPEKTGYLYQSGMILSPDGHCRAFDAQAQGTVGGSGVGVVVLKLLEDALADRDHIYAVIRGSAINNDGASKVNYTAPSVEGQASAIIEAQAISDVTPDSISYIEAHGTGTPLGDPIEIAALTQAFGASREETQFCAIGSVKTNIGHADATAGIAGLIKTTLALQNRQLPPSLHFTVPNPQIDFANSPFYVNQELSAWETSGGPRRAGVSSFGIGGTNAHAILEEAPTPLASGTARSTQLLLLSTKTQQALETATTHLADSLRHRASRIEEDDLQDLADVAYTQAVGRTRFKHKRMLICQTHVEAVEGLTTADPQHLLTAVQEAGARPIAFMFSGQGSQYVDMGRDLYEHEALFHQKIDQCAALLSPYLGLDIRTILYPQDGMRERAATMLQETWIAQPALFTLEYALAQLWIDWIGQPQAMIGHSIGEYVAATLAGIFTLEDALALVAARGQLMQTVPAGSMLSTPLPVAQAMEIVSSFDNKVSLAAVNGASLTVISGPTERVLAVKEKLATQGVDSRLLHTSHAFHSAMMDPILTSFGAKVRGVTLHPPQIPIISNVTGTWLSETEATAPEYWVQHLRQAVLFAPGLATLMEDEQQVLIEVGPGRTLQTLATQHPARSGQVILSSLRHPQAQVMDQPFLLTTLGKLWLAGVDIDWHAFYRAEDRNRVSLPTYPFDRQRYWIDPPCQQESTSGLVAQPENRSPSTTNAAVIREEMARWFYAPSWQRSLTEFTAAAPTKNSPWLLFADSYGLGESLAQQLSEAGHHVILVTVQERFIEIDRNSFGINPRRRTDYDTLLQELRARDVIPKKIAHLWSISDTEEDITTMARLEKMQAFGFYSLLYLAQALGRASFTEQIRLTVISNFVHDVTGDETVVPEKATLAGPLTVIPQEYTNITCRHIDLGIGGMEIPQRQKLLDCLIRELLAQSQDLVVAYRNQHRWVQTFTQVEIPQPLPTDFPLSHSLLRQGGVYLITGGLGNMGLLLAQELATKVQARLVLTARTPLPQRTSWSSWLATHDDHNATSLKIRQVQALEALGSEVLVVSVDVAHYAQMQALLQQVITQFGALHGVIHAAGVAGDEAFHPIQETMKQQCEQQFRAKVYGLLVLDDLLREQPLDFCLFASSIASILGGLGFVAYAAANAFMDRFAVVHNRQSDIPWLSINWDAWQFAETESNEMMNSGLGATIANLAIQPQEGLDIVHELLASSALSTNTLSQIIISTGNLHARIDQWVRLNSHQVDRASQSKQGATANAGHPRPEGLSAYVQPRTEIEGKLCGIYEKLLGISPVGIYDDFFELGGHSLLGTQLISWVRAMFEQEISLQSMFEYPTVARLAEYIAARSVAAPSKNKADGTEPMEEGRL